MDTIGTFINRFEDLAKAIQRKFSIPYLVTLGQAALESNWGQKAPGNNFFGIKAGSNWDGDTQVFLTTEIVTPEQFKKLKAVKSSTRLESGNYKITIYQKFRKYDTPNDSFIDYAKLLSTSDYYKKAFNYTDPSNFAREIAKNYATQPDYFQRLYNVMVLIKKKPVKVLQIAV